MIIKCKLEKETKNKVRYMEANNDPTFDHIYIRKNKLSTPYPKEIEVSLNFYENVEGDD